MAVFQRRSMRLVLLFTLILLTGCTTAGTQGFNLFPQGHQLTDEAKAMRDVNSGVLQVPRELEKEPLAAYTVEPGDVLLIQALDLDSPVRLPGDQPVMPDGTINLGKYGQHVVMGRTVPEIEAIVKNAIQMPKAGPITVRIVSRQSKVYYVLGAVNSPGVFMLNGRETVLDGIVAAGGLTDNASRNHIILARPSRPCSCRTVLPVCYRNIVQLGDTTTNYQLAPGDRIYIPSRTILESIFGQHCDDSPCQNCPTACQLPRITCGVPGCAPSATILAPVAPGASPPGRLSPSETK
jgi:polysaccharide biosynthesis/export protein